MKKIFAAILFLCFSFFAKAQDTETIQALNQKIDSLEQRLDEKNYTRVPNAALEDELNKKVKDSVSEWFDSNKWINGSIFGGLILAVGSAIFFFGRRWVTTELDSKLSKDVSSKTEDIKALFAEHKASIKEDTKEWKDSIMEKMEELLDSIKKYRADSTESIRKFKEDVYSDLEKITQQKFLELDQSNKDIQSEMNEALDQLFAETVESISETAQSKKKADPKAEEQIKFVLKRLKTNKIQNDTLASQALESIILYYYYTLNTDKMDMLIKEYDGKYNLSNTIYANAALAFLDKYESLYQPAFRTKCLEYCEDSIRKLPDYGTAFAVKLEVHLIDMVKAFDDAEKDAAKKEVERILHQVIQMESKYIHKEVTARLENDGSRADYMGKYIPQLQKYFPQQMQAIKDKIPAA